MYSKGTLCHRVQAILEDGIHTWYNTTEVLVVRVSTITKAMNAKNACLAEQFIPLI